MKRLLLCLAAVVALSGCAVTAHQEPLASGAPSPESTSAPAAPAAMSAVATDATDVTATPQLSSPTIPTRFRIGDIDAPVVPVVLTGSALTPPDDPRVLGWWGKRAGSPQGTTLLTGHTVHDGGGAFDNLEDTRVGARARVNGHSYRVRSVEVISKEALARRAPAVFAQTGRPKLVLVTCEDYDRATGHYASNVLVILTPDQ